MALVFLSLVPPLAFARDILILRGGAIYTLDPARPWASAVVIADGRIAYVGDDRGAAAFAGDGARVVALDGRMVLPGFHDAHIHPMTGAMRLLRCRLGAFRTALEIEAAVRACAAAKAPGQWLLGAGWSPTAFGAGGPMLAALDDLAPDHPAFLTTEDGFTGWVNSRALTLAGVDPLGRKPTIEGLERDPVTGRPSGVVRGEAAGRVRRVIPRPSQAEYREALRRSTAMANSFGVTSMIDASVAPPALDAYRAADLAGELTVRILAAQLVDPDLGPGQVDAMIAARDRVRGRRLRADAAKLFLDGEIDQHTAALLAPYIDAPAERGELMFKQEALAAIVRRLDAAGFRIQMHAMGDGAVRAGLDAIEQAARVNGDADRRHQLSHLGVVDPGDVARFAALGVAADFQPHWFAADDPVAAATEAALGPVRSDWILPMGRMAAAGGRVTIGSDWPGPTMNPLDAIQAAVTRQPLGGGLPPRQPGSRVDLATAIAAHTINGAWATGDQARSGSIEVGKAADIVVLERNLFEVKVDDLHRVRILLTLLDGEVVYRDPQVTVR